MPNKASIRVVMIDDSPTVLARLSALFQAADEFALIGAFSDPKEAQQAIPTLLPDVYLLDLHMPGLNGLALTEWIMAHHPAPILLFTSVSDSGWVDLHFRTLQAGAVDLFNKDRLLVRRSGEGNRIELLRKLRIIAKVPVIRKRYNHSPPVPAAVSTPLPRSAPGAPRVAHSLAATGGSGLAAAAEWYDAPISIVGIGASTGGPKALLSILQDLPQELPVPFVLVQHIGDDFVDGFVNWLQGELVMEVCVARDGEQLRPGLLYVAAAKHHITVDAYSRIHLDLSPPQHASRPSIDRLFRSLAQSFGPRALGILLTGMGRDGAQGLLAIKEQKGLTIAQSEESCAVFGMPGEAVRLDAHRLLLSPSNIAQFLRQTLVES